MSSYLLGIFGYSDNDIITIKLTDQHKTDDVKISKKRLVEVSEYFKKNTLYDGATFKLPIPNSVTCQVLEALGVITGVKTEANPIGHAVLEKLWEIKPANMDILKTLTAQDSFTYYDMLQSTEQLGELCELLLKNNMGIIESGAEVPNMSLSTLKALLKRMDYTDKLIEDKLVKITLQHFEHNNANESDFKECMSLINLCIVSDVVLVDIVSSQLYDKYSAILVPLLLKADKQKVVKRYLKPRCELYVEQLESQYYLSDAQRAALEEFDVIDIKHDGKWVLARICNKTNNLITVRLCCNSAYETSVVCLNIASPGSLSDKGFYQKYQDDEKLISSKVMTTDQINSLRIDDIIDAREVSGRWLVSKIVDITEHHIHVTYAGYPHSQDCDMRKTSCRIAKYGTFEPMYTGGNVDFEKRLMSLKKINELKVGDDIDVYDNGQISGGVLPYKWYTCQITEINDKHITVLYAGHRHRIDKYAKLIAPVLPKKISQMSDLKVGDFIDARDKQDQWYLAQVIQINNDATITVSFPSFTENCNETISGFRISERGSMTDEKTVKYQEFWLNNHLSQQQIADLKPGDIIDYAKKWNDWIPARIYAIEGYTIYVLKDNMELITLHKSKLPYYSAPRNSIVPNYKIEKFESDTKGCLTIDETRALKTGDIIDIYSYTWLPGKITHIHQGYATVMQQSGITRIEIPFACRRSNGCAEVRLYLTYEEVML